MIRVHFFCNFNDFDLVASLTLIVGAITKLFVYQAILLVSFVIK